jgi:hypothetical protein
MPADGLTVMVGTVTVNAAETMKFEAPSDTSTKPFAEAGTVIVGAGVGTAPAPVVVNWKALEQAELPVALKQ